MIYFLILIGVLALSIWLGIEYMIGVLVGMMALMLMSFLSEQEDKRAQKERDRKRAKEREGEEYEFVEYKLPALDEVAAAESAAEASDPVNRQIAGVPVIGQYPVLPTGCEATALTMLLQWAGVHVTKEAVADTLVKEPLPYDHEGTRVGGHPNRAFVGDPYTEESFGVFHRPIAATLEAFLPGQAADHTGLSFEELLALIDSGRPVVVWATIDLREPQWVDRWADHLDPATSIDWQSPEHCMILTGYTATAVIVNDPHTGQTEQYPRELFRMRWEQLGRQAVTIQQLART